MVRPDLRPVSIFAAALLAWTVAGCAHPSGNSGAASGQQSADRKDRRARALDALPTSTKGLVRIQPDGLASLQNHPLMANVLRTGVCSLAAQIGSRLQAETGQCGMSINTALQALTGASLENLDGDRSVWLALATTGHEELLRRSLWGLPSSPGGALGDIRLHVRAIVPAVDASGLSDELDRFCAKSTTPCPSTANIEPTPAGEFVRVDVPVPSSKASAAALADALDGASGGRPDLLSRSTAAQRTLFKEGPAVVVYSRFRALADLSALEALYRRALARDSGSNPTPLRQFTDMHRASAAYAIHRPKSAEFEDVAVAMGGDASGAWTELLLTPTARGESLADVVESTNAPPVTPSVPDAHARMSWRIDTPRLLDQTARPRGNSMERIRFVLRQSITSQLQFTGYPFAQGHYLWKEYSRNLDHQPLVQAGGRLLEARYFGAAVRLEQGDAGPGWSAAAGARFPDATWSESDLEQLRGAARAFLDTDTTFQTATEEGGQTLRFAANRDPAESFSPPADETTTFPLEMDLVPVENVRIERPIARMILGSAPIRLRGRFDSDAAVVRLAAGDGASPAPSDPDGDAGSWTPGSTDADCVLPVFEARHHAFRRLQSAGPSERPTVWEETSSTVTERLRSCSGADWALPKWRKYRDRMYDQLQSRTSGSE